MDNGGDGEAVTSQGTEKMPKRGTRQAQVLQVKAHRGIWDSGITAEGGWQGPQLMHLKPQWTSGSGISGHFILRTPE